MQNHLKRCKVDAGNEANGALINNNNIYTNFGYPTDGLFGGSWFVAAPNVPGAVDYGHGNLNGSVTQPVQIGSFIEGFDTLLYTDLLMWFSGTVVVF